MHRTTRRFWKCFDDLPEAIQRTAKLIYFIGENPISQIAAMLTEVWFSGTRSTLILGWRSSINSPVAR
jgi:hypothetical protein